MKKISTLCVEGMRTYETFCQAGFVPEVTYVTQAAHARYPQLQALDAYQQSVRIVGQRRMKQLSTATTPSGILGIFPIPRPTKPINWSRTAILAQIQDPGNMGTLIRTAAALALTDVIVIEGASPWGPKVLQAGAGAHAHTAIHEMSFDELRAAVPSHVTLGALTVTGGTSPRTYRTQPIVLMIGNEAHGLPVSFFQGTLNCTVAQITIPMPGATESLNAAVAGAIALYTIFGPE